jgi:hypothetical protein
MGMVAHTAELKSAASQANVVFRADAEALTPRRPDGALSTDFQFWSGLSGRGYVHTIFDLIGCPRVPACSYVLVRRAADGKRSPLRIGTVAAEAWSLNLAEIRHRAAQLGANEVHLHLIAGDAGSRAKIAEDLQAGHFAELSPEPTERPAFLC